MASTAGKRLLGPRQRRACCGAAPVDRAGRDGTAGRALRLERDAGPRAARPGQLETARVERRPLAGRAGAGPRHDAGRRPP